MSCLPPIPLSMLHLSAQSTVHRSEKPSRVGTQAPPGASGSAVGAAAGRNWSAGVHQAVSTLANVRPPTHSAAVSPVRH